MGGDFVLLFRWIYVVKLKIFNCSTFYTFSSQLRNVGCSPLVVLFQLRVHVAFPWMACWDSNPHSQIQILVSDQLDDRPILGGHARTRTETDAALETAALAN